jgi:anti-sigma factor RsiW
MELAPNPICDRVRGQISLELDGELSQLERAMVAKHVQRCPSCAAFHASATAFTDALRSAPLEALARPIALPSLRKRAYGELRSGAIRIGAAAAGIAIALSLGLTSSDPFGSSALGPTSTAHSAYLQSMDYEQQLIEEQANRSSGSRIVFAV